MSAPEIFLSHNMGDREAVTAVRDLVRVARHCRLLDRDKLLAALPWPQALVQALRQVMAVAVFIGRQLCGRQKRELWFALDRQVSGEKEGRPIPVVPFPLRCADLTPGSLFSNAWIDLRNGHSGLEADEVPGAMERPSTQLRPPAHVPGQRSRAKVDNNRPLVRVEEPWCWLSRSSQVSINRSLVRFTSDD